MTKCEEPHTLETLFSRIDNSDRLVLKTGSYEGDQFSSTTSSKVNLPFCNPSMLFEVLLVSDLICTLLCVGKVRWSNSLWEGIVPDRSASTLISHAPKHASRHGTTEVKRGTQVDLRCLSCSILSLMILLGLVVGVNSTSISEEAGEIGKGPFDRWVWR